MKTKAPSSMKRLAAAWPMPVAPPVITAVFPANFCPCLLLISFSCYLLKRIFASDLRHAPIDGEIHTGDVRTFIGREERDCCRDFLGHASATHWDLRGELCDL